MEEEWVGAGQELSLGSQGGGQHGWGEPCQEVRGSPWEGVALE